MAADPERTVARLRERHAVRSVKGGYVRAAVHFYNAHEELKRFLSDLAGGQ